VGPEQMSAFKAYRAVAKRRAFRAASDNSDMLRHKEND
jgi:hypothetical protein